MVSSMKPGKTACGRNDCPGCGHDRFSSPYHIARQPVVLNYRFATPAAAQRVIRKDIHLVQCLRCGLVFNNALDAEVIPYDSNYENRQCFSPAFQTHLEELADGLIARHDLRGRRILECGCGKGDFLKLICRRAAAEGLGYDTSYEGKRELKPDRIRFLKRYVTARDITKRADAIVCRHVVEHVGEIGTFLKELHAIAVACGDPVTVIETPSFEWIVKNHCFWDIFYEHCNYFTLPCLAYLSRQAGFIVADQRLVFGGQYQLLELKLPRAGKARRPRPPGAAGAARLPAFARQAEANLIKLERKLRRAGAGAGWAVWGAGAKGVALVNRLQSLPPRFVIDVNRAKQGCVIPGSKVSVVAPDDPRIAQLALVLVANPNYAAEITSTLRAGGYANIILTL